MIYLDIYSDFEQKRSKEAGAHVASEYDGPLRWPGTERRFYDLDDGSRYRMSLLGGWSIYYVRG